ncbi:MAG: D-aminoacyl-tRNA deacylase [Candidatus Anstonellaceae archaeon]
MKEKLEDIKGAILYSTKNIASLNIIENLKKYYAWKEEGKQIYFSSCGKKECCTTFFGYGQDVEILEVKPTKEMAEKYFLYASSHKSEKNLPSLTVHVPGNWVEAEYGGEPKTLNYSFGSKIKQILKYIDEESKKNSFGWQISMEVDHHGPTIKEKKALIFVEIGSGPEEWKDQIAGKIIATAIFKALLIKSQSYKTYIAFGGGHYAPKFSEFVLGKRKLEGEEIAISHICPKYRVERIDKEVIKQAIEKNFEKIEGALIDKKGLDKSGREKIVNILEELKLKYYFV